MKVLVTGGAGYIGVHTCLELIQAGHDVVVYDNFSNGHAEALRRVERITGRRLDVVVGDVCNQSDVEKALRSLGCEAVCHFAALKAVGESVMKPLQYYENNVVGTLRLLRAMQNTGVQAFVFSSSATVYGEPQWLPVTECHPLSATNPYGRSKLFVEEMLRDLYRSEPTWRIAMLRYFNPVGAHESGLIGEDPQGVPNNLMPLITDVASGKRDFLDIWGNDYSTHDGTGVRDYIHVVDLALGHVKALETLSSPQCIALNLGTGIGYSVLDIVRNFELASGKKVPYRIAGRRDGDVGVCYGNPSHAQRAVNWKAERDLKKMCEDQWRWRSLNPRGYS